MPTTAAARRGKRIMVRSQKVPVRRLPIGAEVQPGAASISGSGHRNARRSRWFSRAKPRRLGDASSGSWSSSRVRTVTSRAWPPTRWTARSIATALTRARPIPIPPRGSSRKAPTVLPRLSIPSVFVERQALERVEPGGPGALRAAPGHVHSRGNLGRRGQKLARLAELGVTAVEVMPVAEFPGAFGWGYDGVDLFAPFHHYGTPDDMRRFVDQPTRSAWA